MRPFGSVVRMTWFVVVVASSVLLSYVSCALIGNDVGIYNARIRQRNNPLFISTRRARSEKRLDELDEQATGKNIEGAGYKANAHSFVPQPIRDRLKRDLSEIVNATRYDEQQADASTMSAMEVEQDLAASLIIDTEGDDQGQHTVISATTTTFSENENTNSVIDETPSRISTATLPNQAASQNPSREKIAVLVFGLSAAILAVLVAVLIVNCFTMKIYLSEIKERKAFAPAAGTTPLKGKSRARGGISPSHTPTMNDDHHPSSAWNTQKSPDDLTLPFDISIDPRSVLFGTHNGPESRALRKSEGHPATS